MQTKHHQIDGLQIRVAQHNAKKPLTLLLTNALPQSIACWSSTWDRLSEHFNLLAVDMPGFGLSESRPGIMSPGAQADFLCKVLDYFNISEVFGVGPDVGVPVLLSLAQRAPERILGLNLYDGPGTWPAEFAPPLQSAMTSALVRTVVCSWPFRSYFMRQNYQTATKLGYHTHKVTPEAEREYKEVCFSKQNHADAMDFFASYPSALRTIQENLPNVDVPVLLTWGAHDAFVLPSNADKMARLLPNAEVHVFENAGHFSHEDADQLWIDTLISFLHKHNFPT